MPDPTTGTLAVSWGPSGGVYAYRGYCWRLCLGRLALTYVPNVEIEDLMTAYIEGTPDERRKAKHG